MSVVMNGKSDPEVDLFVELYIACTAFNTLPKPGGLLDQDSYMMYGLLGCVKAFREKEGIKSNQLDSQLQQMARMR